LPLRQLPFCVAIGNIGPKIILPPTLNGHEHSVKSSRGRENMAVLMCTRNHHMSYATQKWQIRAESPEDIGLSPRVIIGQNTLNLNFSAIYAPECQNFLNTSETSQNHCNIQIKYSDSQTASLHVHTDYAKSHQKICSHQSPATLVAEHELLLAQKASGW
jgi:hypothetical protein